MSVVVGLQLELREFPDLVDKSKLAVHRKRIRRRKLRDLGGKLVSLDEVL